MLRIIHIDYSIFHSVMLSVFMMSVIILSVVAPFYMPNFDTVIWHKVTFSKSI
jgi:hypothetical protein